MPKLVPPQREVRGVKIVVKLTCSERDALERHCVSRGIPMGRFVRESAFSRIGAENNAETSSA